MKAKTIKAVLRKRFDGLLESIEDEAVRRLVAENSIITGGSIVSLLQNENVNDFDVYFRTPRVAYEAAKYYVAKMQENPPPSFANGRIVEIRPEWDQTTNRVRIYIKSAGVAGEESAKKEYQYFEGVPDPEEQAQKTHDYINQAMGVTAELDDQAAEKLEGGDTGGKKKYRPIFMTGNAITLANQFQLVLRFHGEPADIHRNYDFVHCTSYWTSWNNLVLPASALEAILTKELRYVGSLYPLCSIIRTRKFLSRGWQINAGQYVKMCWQISQLDLTKVEVLEEQLVGVDAAYFQQVIELLKAAPDPQHIDGAYLMTVIDRLF